MVTEAANFTAEEALDADVIDLIAADDGELLAELDGFEVAGPKAQTLDTAGLEIDEREMPLSYEILQLLVNPTVAYLLLLIGFVGIAIEFFSPGAIIPGRDRRRLAAARRLRLRAAAARPRRGSRCS